MLTSDQILQKYGSKPQSAPRSTLGSGSMTADQILQKYGQQSQPEQVRGGVLSVLSDVGKGALKGAGRTVLGIGELGTKTLGRLVGAQDIEGTSRFVENQRQTTLKPTNLAQKIGFGAEQIGEFFLPGGAVTKGGKAIEGAAAVSRLGSLGRSAVSILGKAGLEAASSAAVTKAQGGSTKEVGQNALLGAGGSLAGQALNTLAKPISGLLKGSAEKSYAKALGATTKANKVLTSKVVPGLLERNVTALSRKSLLSQVSDSVRVAGEKMDAVLEAIPENSPVNLLAVSSKLDEAKNAFLVAGKNGKQIVADPQAIAHIEGFQRIIKQIGAEDAPFGSVRKLRQIWDKGVEKAGGFYGKTLTEGSLIEAQKSAADALRAELVKGRPNLEIVNKEFNFWSNAQRVIKDTIERTSSQGTPLTKQIFRAAGVAKGGLAGLGLAAIGEVTGSTAWRTVSAVTKNKLAKGLATGDLESVVKIVTRILGSQNVERAK